MISSSPYSQVWLSWKIRSSRTFSCANCWCSYTVKTDKNLTFQHYRLSNHGKLVYIHRPSTKSTLNILCKYLHYLVCSDWCLHLCRDIQNISVIISPGLIQMFVISNWFLFHVPCLFRKSHLSCFNPTL